MSKLENKIGKYAIKNLTLYLMAGYFIGYVVQLISTVRGIDFTSFLTLDPTLILQGQVWRIISWVIIPPRGYAGIQGILFLVLMMYCCFSIGTVLERTWGTFKYNVYIFGGILLTVLSAFAATFILYFYINHQMPISFDNFIKIYSYGYSSTWFYFSTYYINMSIYLGFALTFPDAMVRFMFFIPVKMKWLGIIDGVYFLYDLGRGIYYFAYGYIDGLMLICAVTAAIINIFAFWLINLKSFNPKQAARRAKFQREYNAGANYANSRNTTQNKSFYSQRSPETPGARMRGAGITKHKCAVCGQSEQDNPNLEFRFCSKCNGAYEYCQNHLFSHEHKV